MQTLRALRLLDASFNALTNVVTALDKLLERWVLVPV
jgi:hypothetical protein